MKINFLQRGNKNVTRSGFKEVLNYIPLILALGFVTGFGSFTSLFGAAVISFLFLVFKSPFLVGVTVPAAVTFGALNVYLGGRFETLCALIFTSSVFSFLLAFFAPIKPDSRASKGFCAAVLFSGLVLSLPLIIGNKTFSSLSLFVAGDFGVFKNISEPAFLVSLAVFAIYYYFSKIKNCPALFLAVLGGVVINFVYKMNLPSAFLGFENFALPVSADFGNFLKLAFLGLLGAFVLVSYRQKKEGLLIGASNLVSSLFGAFSGTALKGARLKALFFEFILLLIFVLFFDKIAPYIPSSALGAALSVVCFKGLISLIKSVKPKNAEAKIIFTLCFLATVYNIILGIITGCAVTLIKRTQNGKKN